MEDIWRILEEVCDPEVPVLTILDLGIVRKVEAIEDKLVVTITPTYSGCPAMNTIAQDIQTKLADYGFHNVVVKTVLSPAWTTDWMSEHGKEKLRAYGIAPPVEPIVSVGTLFGGTPSVSCPQCGSQNTQMVSLFGSTACKALYKCKDCLEPFDYFKCLK